MIIKKDFEIVKAKGESRSLALKAKKVSSDEECSTSGSEDEEYAMATFQRSRDDKNGKGEKKCFRCGDPNHLIGECPKPPKDKNQRAFVEGSWSDSGEEDDEKIKVKTCLVARASNEELNGCQWIRGLLCFAKASVLVNGSPSREFQFQCGLKQGDPLTLLLFILVMELLHLALSKVVEAGIFKGIRLNNSLALSHLFYADDALIIGVGISRLNIETAAASIGCSIMNNQFSYLGVMVGSNMSRHKAWVDVVLKIRSRLSKWKTKTLSIGGRLTLLKSVLGASPLYTMSIFKVPKGVLKEMESIRNSFIIGVDNSDKKITWVAWDKVLALKKNRGDKTFHDKFPRMFALEMDKNISVAAKMVDQVIVGFAISQMMACLESKISEIV
nr:hypothetical protein [Tanacetum cinerariifolium]